MLVELILYSKLLETLVVILRFKVLIVVGPGLNINYQSEEQYCLRFDFKRINCPWLNYGKW